MTFPLRFLPFFLSLCVGLLAPGPDRYRQDTLVDIEIRYDAPEAAEVFLVWGIDGWQVFPELSGSTGTAIKNQLLHTPMIFQDGRFAAAVRVPPAAEVDFGFLITELADGKEVSIWDEGYSVIERSATEDAQLIQVRGNLEPALRKWRLQPGDVLLPVFVAAGMAGAIYIAFKMGKRENLRAIGLLLLIAILVLGFAIRIQGGQSWNSRQPDSAERLIGDEPGYDSMARELLQGYGFTWPGRVPLYPIWLSGVYLLSAGSYNAVPYAQSLLGVLTIFLIYRLGSMALDRRAGLLAAGWASVSYILIHQGFHFLSEVLYTPFLLIVAITFWKAWHEPTTFNFAHAGLWVGLSSLVRPALLLFPIFAALALLVFLKNRRALRCGPVYLAASLLAVSPWLLHNYVKYQAITPLQTSNAILWQGSPEYYHLTRDQGYSYMQIWQEVLYPPEGERIDPNSIEGDRYWTKRALESIAAEPLIYLKYAWEKLFTFWIGDPSADWNNTYPFNYQALIEANFLPKDAVQVMIARLLPLAALAAAIFLHHRKKNLLPIYLILVYYTLVHALTHAEARLSEPLQPFLLILVAGAAVTLIDRASIRGGAASLPALQAERD